MLPPELPRSPRVTDRPDPQRLRVWTFFLLAHSKLMRELESQLRDAQHLSIAEYDVLRHLAQAPGRRMRMCDLSDALVYTTSGTTRLLDRMAASGLVVREPSPTDRRVTYAVLTLEGLDLLRRAAVTHLKGVQEYFGALLGEEELDSVESFLGRLASGGR